MDFGIGLLAGETVVPDSERRGRVVQVVTHFGLQVGNGGSILLGLTPEWVDLVIARGDNPRALALGAGINISPEARGRILENTPFLGAEWFRC